MNVLIFGATGMIGGGALRECLEDPGIARVVTLGRSSAGRRHEKLSEISHADLLDYSAIEPQLSGFDRLLLLSRRVVNGPHRARLRSSDL